MARMSLDAPGYNEHATVEAVECNGCCWLEVTVGNAQSILHFPAGIVREEVETAASVLRHLYEVTSRPRLVAASRVQATEVAA